MTRSEVAAMRAHGQASPPGTGTNAAPGLLLVLVVCVCSILGGCEDISLLFQDLTEELRGDQAREGRSGTLRALQVTHAASSVARDMARSPDHRCSLATPESGSTYTIDLKITRERRFESAISWTETRTLERDAHGNMRLVMDATYLDELGQEGGHGPVRLIVGGHGFEGPDSEHLYRRDAGDEDRQALVRAGPGTMQTLLDAAAGWKQRERGRTWVLGSRPLLCGTRDPAARGWLRRLNTRGSIVEASFESGESGRTIDIRWLLEDGVVMHVHAEDRLEPFNETIEVPDPTHVIDVRRKRTWKRVRDLLDRLEAEGAIRRGSGAESPDAN